MSIELLHSMMLMQDSTVGVVVFIVYVLFGVTPKIRFLRWCRRKVRGEPKKAQRDVEEPELEFGTYMRYSLWLHYLSGFAAHQDPYHSPTQLLVLNPAKC